MTYTIKLPQFEGPFDLLLFFIERDELDIYDIPIARVTKDFLDYIHHMEALNIDMASEFILVASTLMRIKAKLLLPRRELDEEGNEIDPRQELVRRLIEYKRYKAILEEIRALEVERSQKEHRGNISKELQSIANKALVDVELESLTMFKLLRTFERLMQRYEQENKKVVHTVVKYNYTVRAQRDHLLKLVKKRSKVDFKKVFTTCENRIHAVFTFLALLELLQMQSVRITIGDGHNNFWISARN